MQAALIFPHQLFSDHPALEQGCRVLLVEDDLFFTQYPFHKQKLVLHRASMQYYADLLTRQGHTVTYVPSASANLKGCFAQWHQEGIRHIRYCDTVDYLLERRLNRYAQASGIVLHQLRSPNFLLDDDEFAAAVGKKYFMASFYIHQRKKFNILVDHNQQPLGGQWSFDAENRKRMPKGLVPPTPYRPATNRFVVEAKTYVSQNFDTHYGNLDDFQYPTTHAEAEKVLEDFLHHRLTLFGDYEDAIVAKQSTLFHSVLTPALNIGLLSPQQIVDKTLAHHHKYPIPLNSLEGFIRQVIGWREFMKGIYVREGVRQRTSNHLSLSRRLPEAFWDGTTGITPIDQTIRKLQDTAYCHHIERLMILGNFMYLCGFDPDEVYRWFMVFFIDAYDWVMVPNVYGMSQYADGGMMTTKPYISGSNYVLKMSDYTKGPWCDVWDGLYWRYLYEHRDTLAKNPRMSMVVNLLKKMDPKKLQQHLHQANQFLGQWN